ncbi:hypothetical protein GOV10_06490 [Candidatus Woesearchaeota archaeon]|nr:hypothetical protein [Candidatus Woesearchaeota archaeon]
MLPIHYMGNQANPTDEDLSVFDNIVFLLNNNGNEFEILEHDFVHRSEDAAKVRGTNLQEAAKALVLRAKAKDGTKKFFMCVVSGDKKMDLRKVKELVNSKNVSLAHPDDVFSVTKLRVGTVPPFPGLFGLEGYCDSAVLKNEYVVFSAASHYKSIRMKAEEWQDVAGVTRANFSQ